MQRRGNQKTAIIRCLVTSVTLVTSILHKRGVSERAITCMLMFFAPSHAREIIEVTRVTKVTIDLLILILEVTSIPIRLPWLPLLPP